MGGAVLNATDAATPPSRPLTPALQRDLVDRLYARDIRHRAQSAAALEQRHYPSASPVALPRGNETALMDRVADGPGHRRSHSRRVEQLREKLVQSGSIVEPAPKVVEADAAELAQRFYTAAREREGKKEAALEAKRKEQATRKVLRLSKEEWAAWQERRALTWSERKAKK
jgi:hypothetical protein